MNNIESNFPITDEEGMRRYLQEINRARDHKRINRKPLPGGLIAPDMRENPDLPVLGQQPSVLNTPEGYRGLTPADPPANHPPMERVREIRAELKDIQRSAGTGRPMGQ